MKTKPMPPKRITVDDIRSWAVQQRILFIDAVLADQGFINRADLIYKFRISKPQAAIDLRLYRQIAPDNMRYENTGPAHLRRYVRTKKFRSITQERACPKTN